MNLCAYFAILPGASCSSPAAHRVRPVALRLRPDDESPSGHPARRHRSASRSHVSGARGSFEWERSQKTSPELLVARLPERSCGSHFGDSTMPRLDAYQSAVPHRQSELTKAQLLHSTRRSARPVCQSRSAGPHSGSSPMPRDQVRRRDHLSSVVPSCQVRAHPLAHRADRATFGRVVERARRETATTV